MYHALDSCMREEASLVHLVEFKVYIPRAFEVVAASRQDCRMESMLLLLQLLLFPWSRGSVL
jgi:hypothetical protein